MSLGKDYSVLLIMWIIGLIIQYKELSKVSKRPIKDQIAFIFLLNFPLILYLNLLFLKE